MLAGRTGTDNIVIRGARLLDPVEGLDATLDVRIDKTWQFKWCSSCETPGKLSAYLDILNVYNQGNVDGFSYDYNFTHRSQANDLPIIPSLGLRLEY